MPTLTNIEAVTRTLQEEMRRDPNIFITGEDVGVRGGVFRATKGLIEEFGDQRVVDSPLAELSIVAIGIGAALYGLRPRSTKSSTKPRGCAIVPMEYGLAR
jgi:2-oxoisovalerate dehydrogenase E1 component beta subunit